jgi:hypothetical protein
MKMGPGLFWGLILIIIGLSLLFKVFFGISVIRLILGGVIILVGLKVLIGGPIFNSYRSENSVVFGEQKNTSPPIHKKEYNTAFGTTVFDYSHIEQLDELHTKVVYNTVFGTTVIHLPKDIPVKIKIDAVFSSGVMPNGNNISFGTSHYKSPNIMSESQLLEIEAHVVFGSLVFKQRK